jgi:hypothetical protein
MTRAAVLLLFLGPSRACPPSSIPHSNTSATPCAGAANTICPYACDAGYVAVGTHACQSYTTTSGVVAIDDAFFGGRCDALCPGDPPCAPPNVPVRWPAASAGVACLATTCAPPDDALRRLARGAYAAWRLGRDELTGIYSGSVDATAPASEQASIAHIGINGVALMFECVAAEMGWIARADAAARITLSLRALAGELPGFALVRQARAGWIPTFFNRSTGASVYGQQPYTVLDSGLNSAGVLFARTYFLNSASRDATPSARAATAELARLAKKVFNLVRFEDGILCDDAGKVSATGRNIPFTLDDDGGCGALHSPLADGFYDFSELHYTVWLAYSRVCAGAAPGACPNAAIESMWAAWQGRRLHPILSYRGHPLLSDWPSYIVHLPFYVAHSFNADASWSALFASHWAADREYFATPAYFAGDAGRYGLAAGPTDRWCSAKDTTYEADMLAGDDAAAGAQGCRLYSPYAVAGYLPAAPAEIAADLLALLAAGEATARVDSFVPGDYVLLRKSLLEGNFSQAGDLTMVDFASELFGLSTIWLGADFWRNNTNHNFSQLAV